MDPTGARSLAELRSAWVTVHARLRAFLERLDRNGLRRAVFDHPLAGRLTPGGALRMLEAHRSRHAGQIHRTRKEV